MTSKFEISGSLIRLMFKRSPVLLAFSIVIGASSGAAYSLVIPFLVGGIELKSNAEAMFFLGTAIANDSVPLVFFSVVFFILLSKASSVILVNNIAKSTISDIKINLANKISNSKIQDIESVGFARLINLLTEDINHLTQAAISLPMIVVSSVTIVGVLGFLAVLNVKIFLTVILCIVIGVAVFQVPITIARRLYNRSRDFKDVIQEGIRGIILGAYELRLNKEKQRRFLKEEIVRPQQHSILLEKQGDAIFHSAGNFSDLFSLFVIGFLVFTPPSFLAPAQVDMFAIVISLIYIAGPVANILGRLQYMNMGRVALQRINELSQIPEENTGSSGAAINTWSTYKAEGVEYKYHSESADGFALKPVSLAFKRSQINFIVGGNGSGKSTLSKILSLHYYPSNGVVSFDNVPVNSENIEQARKKIGVIYSNYYLFSKVYADLSDEQKEQIESYLVTLGLNKKTSFVDGRFSTTRLSDGQRRRLALLVALMEEREIYIFDEWAADQDPGFKDLFYTEVLPQLKARGKLVIAITHDDRYFYCADRVVYMEDGQLKNIVENTETQSTNSKNDTIASL